MRSPRRRRRSRELVLVHEVVLHMAISSCLLPYELPAAVCASSKRCLVEMIGYMWRNSIHLSFLQAIEMPGEEGSIVSSVGPTPVWSTESLLMLFDEEVTDEEEVEDDVDEEDNAEGGHGDAVESETAFGERVVGARPLFLQTPDVFVNDLELTTIVAYALT